MRWLYGLSFVAAIPDQGRMFAVRAKVTTTRGRQYLTNELAFFVGARTDDSEERRRLFDNWREETGRHGIDAT